MSSNFDYIIKRTRIWQHQQRYLCVDGQWTTNLKNNNQRMFPGNVYACVDFAIIFAILATLTIYDGHWQTGEGTRYFPQRLKVTQVSQAMCQYWPESQSVTEDLRVNWAEPVISHSSPSSIVLYFQTAFLSQTASRQSYRCIRCSTIVLIVILQLD